MILHFDAPSPQAAGPRRAGAIPAVRTALFLLALLMLSCLFRDAVWRMTQSWQQEEYSHGYFIPVITALLLLNRMAKHPNVSKASWAGCAAVALSVLVGMLLKAGGVSGILPQLYLLSLIAAYATFWGVKAARDCAGALGFLLFCAPLPRFFYYALSFHMQMISTSFGAHMLELINVPVFQDGNIIDLGVYRLQVAEACSGLRYLFPLLSFSYLFAYMYKASLAKRIVLWLSALPITVGMNGLRIAIIGITVNRWGPQMAEGLLHEFEGGVVFASCIACLALEVRLLQAVGRRGRFDMSGLRLPAFKSLCPPALGAPVYACLFGVALTLLAGNRLPFMAENYLHAIPLSRSFALFPMQIGPWVGRFERIDAVSLTKLDTQDYLLADYAKPGAPVVNLYALYYPHQDSTGNESNHSPSVCIPGSGWQIESNRVKEVVMATGDRLSVNAVNISKDGARQVLYYWFIQGGEPTWDANSAKFYQVRNAMRKQSTNGAMIRVMTIVDPKESEATAESRLTDFLNAGLTVMNNFMFPKAVTDGR